MKRFRNWLPLNNNGHAKPSAEESQAALPECLSDVQRDNAHRDIYVAENVLLAIYLHIVGNYINLSGYAREVIFALTGPFGTGKSVTTIEALYRLGVKVFVLAASAMENRYSGVPADRVFSIYYQAAQHVDETGQPAAVVIDDLDMGVGEFANVSQATTNTQMVITALMEIADHPTMIRGTTPCTRVPIFVTANDLGKIYGALTRPGRMRAFEWNPTGVAREQVARHIFRDLLRPNQIDGLLARTSPHWSIAMYGALRSRVGDSILQRLFSNQPAPKILTELVKSKEIDVSPTTILAVSNELNWRALVKEVEAEHQAKRDYTGAAG